MVVIKIFVCAETSFLSESRIMEISYQLTQRDFYNSFIAHRNRNGFLRWLLRLCGVIAIAGLLVCIVGASVIPFAEWPSSLVPLLSACIFMAYLFWVSPWQLARSQFLKQPAAQGPRTIKMDSVGVWWRWHGGSSEHVWETFIRILESKTQFMFYSSPVCFSIVPKRALTSEQTGEFRALLRQSGVPLRSV